MAAEKAWTKETVVRAATTAGKSELLGDASLLQDGVSGMAG
jgi:hypothetical protein